MQFSCKKCGQIFKPNEEGHLACACGKMTREQDEAICNLFLAAFFGLSPDELRR